jgi:hypothetical protein
MCKKRKYCQPDYWTSLQYQKGQAKNPILGLRLSDAQSFCEWLTLRENSEWHYRIPNKDESIRNFLRPLGKSPLGYWVSGTKDNHHDFAWLGEVPVDVRLINKIPEFDAFARSRTRFLDLEISIAELGISLHIVRRLSRGIEFLRFVDLARSRAQDLQRHIFRTLYIKIDIPRAQRRASEIARILNNISVSNAPKDPTTNFSNKVEKAIDDISQVTIDLFTLQERIAGRSPAFEGIRLVKERIK